MCVFSQPDDAPVNGVDPLLRFTPASGTNSATFQCSLPPAELSEIGVQRFGIVVVDELAVHRQRSNADIDGAAEVGFLLGADGSGSVLLLPCRQADRHLDASLEPTLWAGATLAIALSDYAD